MKTDEAFVISRRDILDMIKNRITDTEIAIAVLDVLTDLESQDVLEGIFLLLVWHNQGAQYEQLTDISDDMYYRLYLTIISDIGHCSFRCEEMFVGDDDWVSTVESICDYDRVLVDKVIYFLEDLVYGIISDIFYELRGPGGYPHDVSMDVMCDKRGYLVIDKISLEN